MSIISWTSPRPSERILPASMRDERAEVGLVLAQQLAELAHQRAAHRRRHRAPLAEGGVCGADDVADVARRCARAAARAAAGDRAARGQRAVRARAR